MADDVSAEDPQENPTNTDHLPVSGEVGSGPVSYHDPLTQDTDDTATSPDNLDELPLDSADDQSDEGIGTS
jgi:hypothetical protein